MAIYLSRVMVLKDFKWKKGENNCEREGMMACQELAITPMDWFVHAKPEGIALLCFAA